MISSPDIRFQPFRLFPHEIIVSIEMKEPEYPAEGSVGKAECARVLTKHVIEALGPFAKEFQTDGVEIGRDGPHLIFYNGDADLLEIVFYAVDDRRHIVFQRALRHTYQTNIDSFEIYDDDESLVKAILPTLRHMVMVLVKLGIIKCA